MRRTPERAARFARLRRMSVAVLAVAASVGALPAQSPGTLAERIQRIVDRPEFKRAIFGVEFYSLDSSKPIYTMNAEKLFVPGSTTKLLTEGTAAATLQLPMHPELTPEQQDRVLSALDRATTEPARA